MICYRLLPRGLTEIIEMIEKCHYLFVRNFLKVNKFLMIQFSERFNIISHLGNKISYRTFWLSSWKLYNGQETVKLLSNEFTLYSIGYF